MQELEKKQQENKKLPPALIFFQCHFVIRLKSNIIALQEIEA